MLEVSCIHLVSFPHHIQYYHRNGYSWQYCYYNYTIHVILTTGTGVAVVLSLDEGF